MITVGKVINIKFYCSRICPINNISESDKFKLRFNEALANINNVSNYAYYNIYKENAIDRYQDRLEHDLYSCTSYKMSLDDSDVKEFREYIRGADYETTNDYACNFFSNKLNKEVIGFYNTGYRSASGLINLYNYYSHIDNSFNEIRIITNENLKLMRANTFYNHSYLCTGPIITMLNNLYGCALTDISEKLKIKSSANCNFNRLFRQNDAEFSLDLCQYLDEIRREATKEALNKLAKSEIIETLNEMNAKINIDMRSETLTIDFKNLINDLLATNYKDNTSE